MIALNLLEQELGIDDTQNMDLDEFLESIVGKDQLKELDDEVQSSLHLLLIKFIDMSYPIEMYRLSFRYKCNDGRWHCEL